MLVIEPLRDISEAVLAVTLIENVDDAAAYTFAVAGGIEPYSYTFVEAQSLSVNAGSGVLSYAGGATLGVYVVTVSADDAAAASAPIELLLTVEVSAKLSAELSDGARDGVYSFVNLTGVLSAVELSGVGGIAPYTFTLLANDNFGIDADGKNFRITAEFTDAVTVSVVWVLEDSDGRTPAVTGTVQVEIRDELGFADNKPVVNVTVGVKSDGVIYTAKAQKDENATYSQIGTHSSFTVSVSDSTGRVALVSMISALSVAMTATLTIKAVDGAAQATLILEVRAFDELSASLAAGFVGQTYAGETGALGAVEVSGGSGDYGYALLSMVPGFEVSQGTLSAEDVAAGVYTVTVVVSDNTLGGWIAATAEATVSVGASLSLEIEERQALVQGEVGEELVQVQVSGGDGSYKLSGQDLSSGLTISLLSEGTWVVKRAGDLSLGANVGTVIIDDSYSTPTKPGTPALTAVLMIEGIANFALPWVIQDMTIIAGGNVELSAEGGTEAKTYGLSPKLGGFSLSSAGVLSVSLGADAGSYTLTVVVSDETAGVVQAATATLSVAVLERLQLLSVLSLTVTTSETQDVVYSFAAKGGMGDKTYSLENVGDDFGFVIDDGNLRWLGNAEAGLYTLSVLVEDKSPNESRVLVTVLVIENLVLAVGEVLSPVWSSFDGAVSTLSASGGNGDELVFALVGDSQVFTLAAGSSTLSLNAGLRGHQGAATLSVTVSVSNGNDSAEAVITVLVSGALQVSLADGLVAPVHAQYEGLVGSVVVLGGYAGDVSLTLSGANKDKFELSSGSLSLQVDVSEEQTLTVTVVASRGDETEMQEVVVAVYAPLGLSVMSAVTVTAHQRYTLTIIAGSGGDASSYSYTLTSPTLAGVSINAVNGELVLSLTVVALHTLTVHLSDGAGSETVSREISVLAIEDVVLSVGALMSPVWSTFNGAVATLTASGGNGDELVLALVGDSQVFTLAAGSSTLSLNAGLRGHQGAATLSATVSVSDGNDSAMEVIEVLVSGALQVALADGLIAPVDTQYEGLVGSVVVLGGYAGEVSLTLKGPDAGKFELSDSLLSVQVNANSERTLTVTLAASRGDESLEREVLVTVTVEMLTVLQATGDVRVVYGESSRAFYQLEASGGAGGRNYTIVGSGRVVERIDFGVDLYEGNVGGFHYPDGATMTVFSLDDEGNLWAEGSAAAGHYLLTVEVSDNGFQVQRQTVSVVIDIQATVAVTVRSIPHNLRINTKYLVGTVSVIGLLPGVNIPFLPADPHVDFVGGIAIKNNGGIFELEYDRKNIDSGLDGNVLPVGEHILSIDAGMKDEVVITVLSPFMLFYELYERAAYEGIVLVEKIETVEDTHTWHIPGVLSSLQAGRVGTADRFHHTVSIYVEQQRDNGQSYQLDRAGSKPSNLDSAAGGDIIILPDHVKDGVFEVRAPYYASIWEVVIYRLFGGGAIGENRVTATIRFSGGNLAVQPLYDGDLPVGVEDSHQYNIPLTASASGVLLTVTTTGGDVESYGDYQVGLVSIVKLGQAESEKSTEQVSYVTVSAESGEVMLLVDRLPDDFQEGSRTLAIKRIAGDDESARVVRIVLSLDLPLGADGVSGPLTSLGGEEVRLHEFRARGGAGVKTYDLSGTGAEGFSLLDGVLVLLADTSGGSYTLTAKVSAGDESLTFELTVLVVPPLSFKSPSVEIIAGESVELSAEGGTEAKTYGLSPKLGGFSLSPAGVLSVSVGADAGSYTLTVVVSDETVGVVQAATAMLTVAVLERLQLLSVLSLTVTTSETQDVVYSFAAKGGMGNKTYSLENVGDDFGFEIDGGNLRWLGNAEAGLYTLSVLVVDESPHESRVLVTVLVIQDVVLYVPEEISVWSSFNGVLATLAASGGIGDELVFALVGDSQVFTIPAGSVLSLNAGLRGHQGAATLLATVRVSDGNDSAEAVITVLVSGALQVSLADGLDAPVHAQYEGLVGSVVVLGGYAGDVLLNLSGANAGKFELLDGALSLSVNVSEEQTLTVTVMASRGDETATQEVVVAVYAPLGLLATSEVVVTTHQRYTLTVVEGSGGDASSYSYTLTSPTLAGVSINADNGELLLSLTVAASHTLTVQLSDGAGSEPVSQAIVLMIKQRPAAIGAALRDEDAVLTVTLIENVADAAAYTFAITGGVAPYSYTFAKADGLSVNVTSGVLSYSAGGAKPGVYVVTVSADDDAAVTAPITLLLTVEVSAVLTVELSEGAKDGVGSFVNLTGVLSAVELSGVGGIAPYTFTLLANDNFAIDADGKNFRITMAFTDAVTVSAVWVLDDSDERTPAVTGTVQVEIRDVLAFADNKPMVNVTVGVKADGVIYTAKAQQDEGATYSPIGSHSSFTVDLSDPEAGAVVSMKEALSAESTVTLTIKVSRGTEESALLTLEVRAYKELSASLAAGFVGQIYVGESGNLGTVDVSGGSKDYGYSWILPAVGFTDTGGVLEANGQATVGVYTVTVVVSDNTLGGWIAATARATVSVGAALSMEGEIQEQVALVEGEAGQVLLALLASGGEKPYSISDDLPSGLAITTVVDGLWRVTRAGDLSEGANVGTVIIDDSYSTTEPGTPALTVTVTIVGIANFVSPWVIQDMAIIAGGSVELSAEGGTDAKTYGLSPKLGGFSLSPAGVLSVSVGADGGSYTLTVVVSDLTTGAEQAATATLKVEVVERLQLLSVPSLTLTTTGEAGDVYTLVVKGGVGEKIYSLNAGDELGFVVGFGSDGAFLAWLGDVSAGLYTLTVLVIDEGLLDLPPQESQVVVTLLVIENLTLAVGALMSPVWSTFNGAVATLTASGGNGDELVFALMGDSQVFTLADGSSTLSLNAGLRGHQGAATLSATVSVSDGNDSAMEVIEVLVSGALQVALADGLTAPVDSQYEGLVGSVVVLGGYAGEVSLTLKGPDAGKFELSDSLLNVQVKANSEQTLTVTLAAERGVEKSEREVLVTVTVEMLRVVHSQKASVVYGESSRAFYQLEAYGGAGGRNYTIVGSGGVALRGDGFFDRYNGNVGDFHYPDGGNMTVFSLDEGNLWAAGSAAVGAYLLAVEVSDNGLPVQRQTVSVTVNIQAAVVVSVRSIPHNIRVSEKYIVGTVGIVGHLPGRVEIPFTPDAPHVDFVGGIAIVDEDEDGIFDLQYSRGTDDSGLADNVLPVGEHILIIDMGRGEKQDFDLVELKVVTDTYERAAYEGVVVIEEIETEEDTHTWHIPGVLSSLQAGQLEQRVGGSDRFHYTVSIYVEQQRDNGELYQLFRAGSKPSNLDAAAGGGIHILDGHTKDGVFEVNAPYYASIWEVVIFREFAGSAIGENRVTATIRFSGGNLAVQPLYDGDLPVGVKDSDKYNIPLTATESGVLLTVTTTGGDVESYGDYQVGLVSIVKLGQAESEESTEVVPYVTVSAESGEVMLLVDMLPDDFQEGSRTLAIKRLSGDGESIRVVRIVLSLDLPLGASGVSGPLTSLGGEEVRLHEFNVRGGMGVKTYDLSGTGAEGFSLLDGALVLLADTLGGSYTLTAKVSDAEDESLTFKLTVLVVLLLTFNSPGVLKVVGNEREDDFYSFKDGVSGGYGKKVYDHTPALGFSVASDSGSLSYDGVGGDVGEVVVTVTVNDESDLTPPEELLLTVEVVAPLSAELSEGARDGVDSFVNFEGLVSEVEFSGVGGFPPYTFSLLANDNFGIAEDGENFWITKAFANTGTAEAVWVLEDSDTERTPAVTGTVQVQIRDALGFANNKPIVNVTVDVKLDRVVYTAKAQQDDNAGYRQIGKHTSFTVDVSNHEVGAVVSMISPLSEAMTATLEILVEDRGVNAILRLEVRAFDKFSAELPANFTGQTFEGESGELGVINVFGGSGDNRYNLIAPPGFDVDVDGALSIESPRVKGIYTLTVTVLDNELDEFGWTAVTVEATVSVATGFVWNSYPTRLSVLHGIYSSLQDTKYNFITLQVISGMPAYTFAAKQAPAWLSLLPDTNQGEVVLRRLANDIEVGEYIFTVQAEDSYDKTTPGTPAITATITLVVRDDLSMDAPSPAPIASDFAGIALTLSAQNGVGALSYAEVEDAAAYSVNSTTGEVYVDAAGRGFTGAAVLTATLRATRTQQIVQTADVVLRVSVSAALNLSLEQLQARVGPGFDGAVAELSAAGGLAGEYIYILEENADGGFAIAAGFLNLQADVSETGILTATVILQRGEESVSQVFVIEVRPPFRAPSGKVEALVNANAKLVAAGGEGDLIFSLINTDGAGFILLPDGTLQVGDIDLALYTLTVQVQDSNDDIAVGTLTVETIAPLSNNNPPTEAITLITDIAETAPFYNFRTSGGYGDRTYMFTAANGFAVDESSGALTYSGGATVGVTVLTVIADDESAATQPIMLPLTVEIYANLKASLRLQLFDGTKLITHIYDGTSVLTLLRPTGRSIGEIETEGGLPPYSYKVNDEQRFSVRIIVHGTEEGAHLRLLEDTSELVTVEWTVEDGDERTEDVVGTVRITIRDRTAFSSNEVTLTVMANEAVPEIYSFVVINDGAYSYQFDYDGYEIVGDKLNITTGQPPGPQTLTVRVSDAAMPSIMATIEVEIRFFDEVKAEYPPGLATIYAGDDGITLGTVKASGGTGLFVFETAANAFGVDDNGVVTVKTATAGVHTLSVTVTDELLNDLGWTAATVAATVVVGEALRLVNFSPEEDSGKIETEFFALTGAVGFTIYAEVAGGEPPYKLVVEPMNYPLSLSLAAAADGKGQIGPNNQVIGNQIYVLTFRGEDSHMEGSPNIVAAFTLRGVESLAIMPPADRLTATAGVLDTFQEFAATGGVNEQVEFSIDDARFALSEVGDLSISEDAAAGLYTLTVVATDGVPLLPLDAAQIGNYGGDYSYLATTAIGGRFFSFVGDL